MCMFDLLYLKYFLKTFNLQLYAYNVIITRAAYKTYILQNNCEDRNKDNKNETTIETKMKDKSNMCLDIVLQKDESKNNNNHEIKKKSKLKLYDNEQNELGDTGIYLIFVS